RAPVQRRIAGMWKRFAWIAAGFVLAAAAADFAVHARYWFIDPRDVAGSQGMFAAGDLILFVFVFGVLSLLPALFLLHTLLQTHPRQLPRLLFALSASGPLCWGLFMLAADRSLATHLPGALGDLYGMALVLLIGPRIVASPITFFFVAVALLL